MVSPNQIVLKPEKWAFWPFKNFYEILEALSRVGYMEFFAHLDELYQMSKKNWRGKKISMSKILKSVNA